MLELLGKTRLFEAWNSQDLEDIAKICQSVNFKAGERIFTAGNPADYLFIVNSGAVELRFTVTHYLAQKEITLDRIREGEGFGWSVFTRSGAYTSTAVAVKDCELMRIRKEDINRLCEEKPHLGYALMKNVSHIIAERFETVRRMLIGEIQHGLEQRELSR